MTNTRAKAIERQLRRLGSPVTVRRDVVTHDFVSSTKTVTGTLTVSTRGVRRRRVQRNQYGDALSIEQNFWLVPAASFDLFTPKDGDLIVADGGEARVADVRTREIAGHPVAYELHVRGPGVE